MKACEATAMNEMHTRTSTMKYSVSTLPEVQKKLRQSASEEVNTILLKNDVYDKIMEFFTLNVIPQEEADSCYVMNNIIELMKMKRRFEQSDAVISVQKHCHAKIEGMIRRTLNR